MLIAQIEKFDGVQEDKTHPYLAVSNNDPNMIFLITEPGDKPDTVPALYFKKLNEDYYHIGNHVTIKENSFTKIHGSITIKPRSM